MTVLNQICVNWGADCIQNLQYFFFNVFIPTSARMPNVSRHSLLEYCSLAWHLRSRTASLSDSLSYTFLEMCRSDSSLQNWIFSSFRSFFSSSKMLLNFSWSSSNILTKSSLFKRISNDSVCDMFQAAKSQVRVSTTY